MNSVFRRNENDVIPRLREHRGGGGGGNGNAGNQAQPTSTGFGHASNLGIPKETPNEHPQSDR